MTMSYDAIAFVRTGGRYSDMICGYQNLDNEGGDEGFRTEQYLYSYKFRQKGGACIFCGIPLGRMIITIEQGCFFRFLHHYIGYTTHNQLPPWATSVRWCMYMKQDERHVKVCSQCMSLYKETHVGPAVIHRREIHGRSPRPMALWERHTLHNAAEYTREVYNWFERLNSYVREHVAIENERRAFSPNDGSDDDEQ